MMTLRDFLHCPFIRSNPHSTHNTLIPPLIATPRNTHTHTHISLLILGSKVKNAVAAAALDDDVVSPVETAFGILAVLAMVTISGYSAIYFEAML